MKTPTKRKLHNTQAITSHSDATRLLRLVSAFKKNGESLRMIGNRFAVDKDAVFKWTRRARKPSDTALVLARYMECDPCESDGLELGRDLDEVV